MNHNRFFYTRQTAARGLGIEGLRTQFSKQNKWYRSRLAAFLPKDKQTHCLDAPCGAGNFLFFLTRQGYTNVRGVDLDKHQIEAARQLALPAEEGDVFKVIADDKVSYGLIASLDFIEHIGKDEAIEFLQLCLSRLDNGGVLLLRTPCADSPFGMHDRYNDITHQWGLSAGLLEVLLGMAGFEKVHVLDERPQPTGVIDFFRWLSFFPFRFFANLFCIGLGVRPPRVWSRSMLVIARKPEVARTTEV